MEEKQVKWRKIGGGTHKIGNRRIKPNQVFFAYPSEIPKGLRDVIVPLKDFEMPEPIQIQEPLYEVKSRGGGWYDVINLVSGKAMNEKGMRKEDAEQLKETLQ